MSFCQPKGTERKYGSEGTLTNFELLQFEGGGGQAEGGQALM